MPTPLWEIDPVSEDAANVALSLVGDVGSVRYRLTEMDLTPPDEDPIYAASADTEGDPFVQARHRNRTISLTFIATAATDALLETGIYGIQQKVDKLRREGGTLKFTSQSGSVRVGDVLFVRFRPEFTKEMYGINKAMGFRLEFECKPYFRGEPVQQSDHTTTTDPALIFVETALAGDVSGLGKLIIDDDQAKDQWWVIWGLQSRFYDSAASAALLYAASGLTLRGGSSSTAGTGSWATNVVRNGALTSNYQAIVSSQATGGGAHWSHVGAYRVFARVLFPTTSVGTVSLCLEWAEGDYGVFNRNAATTFTSTPLIASPKFGAWRIIDLGSVHLTKAAAGTQRWEARLLAKSDTANDDIDVDYLMLVPTDEGSGEVKITPQLQTPAVFGGRDEFNQSAGALAGKTAPIGGTWATNGTGTDYTVDATPGSHFIYRTTTDSSERWNTLGATTYTDVQVAADLLWATWNDRSAQGLLARWVDGSNHLRAHFGSSTQDRAYMAVWKVIAGTVTTLAETRVPFFGGTWYRLWLQIDSYGRGVVWTNAQGMAPQKVMVFDDATLATGGTLASGLNGIYDLGTATATARYFDNFTAAVLTRNAAIYASQSLEVRHDSVIREDSTGTLMVSTGAYEGDYLRLPPAGKEGRSARILVASSRNQPGEMSDPAIDDKSARLTYTPRYLVLGP